MAIFSSLRALRPIIGAGIKAASINQQKNALQMVQKRWSGNEHRTFDIHASRWSWNKFKDELHFYLLLGIIPLGTLILYCNIFIGPATLADIPPGYEPQVWEYHKHPIQRWFARYAYKPPDEDYEKMMCHLQSEHEKTQFKQLETKVRQLMADRGDYQGWYYVPIDSVKYAKDHLARPDMYDAIEQEEER